VVKKPAISDPARSDTSDANIRKFQPQAPDTNCHHWGHRVLSNRQLIKINNFLNGPQS
jgi:hypothetical protein